MTHPELTRLRQELAKVLIGQQSLVERLLVGLLTGGHLLIEGVPGLAKTLAIKTLAQGIGAQFRRVQFTPDLLPADLTGTEIYRPTTGDFVVRPGPIFTEVLLADEINRAPAKVQSALLEAMQERQVTIGEATHPLPPLFWVLATQNPIEHEGTYPLPEAQLDRFLLKINVDYPTRVDEGLLIEQRAVLQPTDRIEAVLQPAAVMELRQQVDRVHLDSKIREYILDIVQATRRPSAFGLKIGPWIELGASPRATLALALAGKALAVLGGRDYVVPHDIKSIAPAVLTHRLLLSFDAQADEVTVDRVIADLLSGLATP